MKKETKHLYAFGPFRFDPEERLLQRDGVPVPLPPKIAETLLVLVQNVGQLVEKDELMRQVWPDAFVEEGNLNKNISTLRKALGQCDAGREYIETIPKRGYRFVATVNLETDIEQFQQLVMDVRPHRSMQGNMASDSRVRPAIVGTSPKRRSPWLHRLILSGAGIILVLGFGIAIWQALRSRSAAPLGELEQRQLTANSAENTVWSGAISPSGKYLAYVDSTGIRVKHIESGDLGTVPEPAGLDARRVRWRIASWFPDNSGFIAVALQPPLDASTWLVSLVGLPPRLLRENARGWSVSPDGKWIAFTASTSQFGLHGTSGDHELWVMDSHGEQARRIEADANTTFSRVKWSPDGTRISYLRRHHSPAGPDSSIEVREANGGLPITIVSHPLLEDFLWLRTELIYAAHEPGSRGDSCNLWQMPIAPGGEPRSKARQMTRWAGFCVDDLSATSNGKVISLRRWFTQSSAYVADIDIGQRHIREPSRLTFNDGLNVPTAWSADGKSIIFWARQSGRTGIFRQFLHNQTALPLITGSDDYRVPRLGPDPNSVLYLRVLPDSDPNPALQVMRVPVEGGPAQAILTTHLMDTVRCAPLANLCGIAERSSDQKQIIFTALDLLKGRGRELARFDVKDANGFYPWDISPDGRRIAVLHPLAGQVVIVPIVGNGPRQEFTIRGWQQFGSFDWAADVRVSSLRRRQRRERLYCTST